MNTKRTMKHEPNRKEMIAPVPIRRRKLSDEAALRIEEMIHDGKFPAGTMLPPERELMAMFGVGRASIREALFALNRMGLVQVRNGERPYVTTPTPEKLIAELSGAARHFLLAPRGAETFQEARELFEIGVARLAAERRTKEDIVRLRAALYANIDAFGDVSRFESTDVAFHYALAVTTQNPILVAVHDALAGWLTNQRTLALRHPDAQKIAVAGHKKVFDAVNRGRAEAAGRAMETHLKSIAKLIAVVARHADAARSQKRAAASSDRITRRSRRR
jgi:GntR family transcriptional regulator, sialic acid-inducible nan operon repressor